VVLDMSDKYIITFSDDTNVGLFEAYLKLYVNIGVDISRINTEFYVEPEVARFITDITGRVVNKKQHNIDEILLAIQMSISFYEVKRKWVTVDLKETQQQLIVDHLLPDNAKTHKLLYNSIFDTTVAVYDRNHQLSKLCELYPEFEVADTIFSNFDEYEEYFNGRRFASKDVFINKLKAFTELYSEEESKEYDEEKRIIETIIKSRFIISDDVSKRIRASELYLMVEALYDTPDKNLFRRRLSTYLIEFGVTKKRFTDGYYFFGLEDKIIKSMPTSLQEIMIQRDIDINKTKAALFTMTNSGYTTSEYDSCSSVQEKIDEKVNRMTRNLIKTPTLDGVIEQRNNDIRDYKELLRPRTR